MKVPTIQRLLFATALVALTSVRADADQRPKPKMLYTLSGSKEESFVLSYHGDLIDGTLCPRSVNGLLNNEDVHSINGFALTKQADPSFAEAFADKSFCSINFEGKAPFKPNWGDFVQLTPTHIVSRDPAEMEDGDVPLFEGLMHIVLNEAPCAAISCHYQISANGRELAIVKSVTIEDTTVDPLTTLTYAGEALPMAGVDGSLWVIDGAAEIIAYGFAD